MLYKSCIFTCVVWWKLLNVPSLFLSTKHQKYKLSSSLEDIASSAPTRRTSSPSGSSCGQTTQVKSNLKYSNNFYHYKNQRKTQIKAMVFHKIVLHFKHNYNIYILFHRKNSQWVYRKDAVYSRDSILHLTLPLCSVILFLQSFGHCIFYRILKYR